MTRMSIGMGWYKYIHSRLIKMKISYKKLGRVWTILVRRVYLQSLIVNNLAYYKNILPQLTFRIFIKISDIGDSDKCECLLRPHRIHNDRIRMQGGREYVRCSFDPNIVLCDKLMD